MFHFFFTVKTIIKPSRQSLKAPTPLFQIAVHKHGLETEIQALAELIPSTQVEITLLAGGIAVSLCYPAIALFRFGTIACRYSNKRAFCRRYIVPK